MPELTDRLVHPGEWQTDPHFYPRVPNARLHPAVRAFLRLGNERIAERYVRLYPEADPDAVLALLRSQTLWFRWSGADLFHVTDAHGCRRMVLIETNSAPSGQKSMPLLDEAQEQAGYRRLLEQAFLPLLEQRLPAGRLAVLWDKNPMEVEAYAKVLADLTGEPVHLVHVPTEGGVTRWKRGVLHVRQDGDWVPIRAAFRYVTRRPWQHFVPVPRTAMLNPVIACLAGGRNKLLAAKAYSLFNARWGDRGLRIRYPWTATNVPRDEVPFVLERLGGRGVVKVPYANAGTGVTTITSPPELEAFLAAEHRYERFIVQALVGHATWSSRARAGPLHHVGTVPDERMQVHAADLRMMVAVGREGFFPVALYARRARLPLTAEPPAPGTSWDVLGTNLSVQEGDEGWSTESERLLMMDQRDFQRLGLDLDDLVDAYLQAVMATHAVDGMARALVGPRRSFRRRLFATMNPDRALLGEILREGR